MLSLFITLLCFSSSLAHDRTTGLFLNDQPYMVRPFLIDMNPVELKYLSFMINLDKYTGNCNVSSPKNVFQKKQKTYMLKHLI